MQCNNGVTDGGKKQQDPAPKIVDKVAQAKGVDMLDLAPIQSVVEADALNALYAHSISDVEVTFEYEGYLVTVRSDGEVDLEK